MINEYEIRDKVEAMSPAERAALPRIANTNGNDYASCPKCGNYHAMMPHQARVSHDEGEYFDFNYCRDCGALAVVTNRMTAREKLGGDPKRIERSQVTEVEAVTGTPIGDFGEMVVAILAYPKGGFIEELSTGEYYTLVDRMDIQSKDIAAVETFLWEKYGQFELVDAKMRAEMSDAEFEEHLQKIFLEENCPCCVALIEDLREERRVAREGVN